jgi:hypothetical protein
MFYRVMDRSLTGSNGEDVAHHVARGLRREYGPALNQRLMAEAKIVHGWGLRPKHASAMLLSVKLMKSSSASLVYRCQEHKKVESLKRLLLQDVLKGLNTFV